MWNSLIKKTDHINIKKEDDMWNGYVKGQFVYGNPDYDMVVEFLVHWADEEE